MTTSLASTDANWRHLTGNQVPLYLLADEGDYTEADNCIEFARRIYPKRPLLPWQEALIRTLLAVNRRWALPPSARGRGAASTSRQVVRRRDSDRLLTIRGRQGDLQRSELVDRRASVFQGRSPYRVAAIVEAQGDSPYLFSGPGDSRVGGRRVRIVHHPQLGRRTGRVRGLKIFYDESYALKESEIAALSPTQLASHNPQTIYLSSPVNEEMHVNGYVLTGIRQRALDAIANGDTGTGLFYAEFGAPATTG